MSLFFRRTLLVCMLLVAPLISAQEIAPTSLTVSDSTIQARIEATPQMKIDLTIEFDGVVGLHANNIDIKAQLLSPTSLLINNRLPSSLISAPAALPVLVSIEPKSDKGFAFEGVATVELYTKALHYTAGTPLRLFRSHANGTFEDITQLTSSGSYRARGNTGSFSDFIILADNRTKTEVLNTKYALLSQLVSDNRQAIDASLHPSLDTALNDLNVALQAQNYTAASTATNNLIALTESASGAQIEDVWRSSDDIVNVKGEMLTRLYTLRYSLRTL